MTVAVPIWQDRVSPVLDTASRLLVVRRGPAGESKRKEFALGALPSEALARTVADLGVDVLLCGGVSKPLRRALERAGLRVEGDLCGEVEALLRAFRAGTWRNAEFRMPGCRGRHGKGAPGRGNPVARGPRRQRGGKVRL